MKTRDRLLLWGALLSVCTLLTAGFPARALSVSLSPQGDLQRAPQDYNLRLGEIHLSLQGAASVIYNDNIDRASSSDETNEGWAFKPSLTLGLQWAAIPNYVTLDSQVGIAWTDWIRNKGEDQFSVTGANGLTDGFLHAEFLLTDLDTVQVYDKFSRQSENLNIQARAYPSNYALLTNVLGVRYQHEFSELARLLLEGAHTSARANSSRYNYQNHISDGVTAAFLWRVNRLWEIGPYVRWERYVYDADDHNDSASREGGIAFTYAGPRSLSIEGHLGYQFLNFVNENHQSADNDGKGGTFSIRANYMASDLTTHTLYAAYERYQGTLGPRINFSRDLVVGYTLQLKPRDFWTIQTGVDWLNIHESDDTGEDANLVRFRIGADYEIGRKTTVGLQYQRTDKASKIDTREYRQNLVELTVRHKF